MKYRKWIIALSALMCLGLTACGGGEAPEETTSTEKAVSVSNREPESDSVVISVGKTTVKYNEYRTYLYFLQNSYGGLLGDGIWDYDKAAASGKSLRQEAVESVLRLIIQVKVICKEAAIEGVALGTDEKEQASHDARTVCDGLNDAQKAESGIDFKNLARIFEENKLAQKMYNIEIGKADVKLSAEQSRAARVQLIYFKAGGDNREEIRRKAEQVRQNLGNTGNSFYMTAKENTDAPEIETLVGGSDERTNLAAAVVAMKKGAVSGVIEEKDGFYIACCIEPDSAKLENQYRNQVTQERQTSAFQKAYGQWAQRFEVKVSKALLVEKE